MKFTKKQKNEYLDRLALATRQQMWQVEMAILKDTEQLELKKALFEQSHNSDEEKHLPEKIGKLETEIEEEKLTLQSGAEDLELIERFKNQ